MDINWQCQSVPSCRHSNLVLSFHLRSSMRLPIYFRRVMLNELRDFIHPIVCPKTSVTNHEPSPRNIPEQRRPVINCLFLYIIFSLFRFSFLFLLFLSQTFYVVVFLKDTFFGFETFLRDTLFLCCLWWKMVLIQTDVLTAIISQLSF